VPPVAPAHSIYERTYVLLQSRSGVVWAICSGICGTLSRQYQHGRRYSGATAAAERRHARKHTTATEPAGCAGNVLLKIRAGEDRRKNRLAGYYQRQAQKYAPGRCSAEDMPGGLCQYVRCLPNSRSKPSFRQPAPSGWLAGLTSAIAIHPERYATPAGSPRARGASAREAFRAMNDTAPYPHHAAAQADADMMIPCFFYAGAVR